MGRPAKKRTYVEAKAKRKGELQAEYEFKKAHSTLKKPLEFLEEQGKTLISKIDPFEAAAVLGTTYLVHEMIRGSDDLLKKIGKHPVSIQLSDIWLKAFQAVGAFTETVPLSQRKSEDVAYQSVLEGLGITDMHVWLVSFALSYIIVRHAGSLIGLLDKGLMTVVSLLLV